MFDITSFEENKFYMMMGLGERWSDFDGPFDSVKEATEHLAGFIDEYSSPEMMRWVITKFENEKLDLVKDDRGFPINGGNINWNDEIWYNEELIFLVV